jgi:hypothetical protein
LRNHVATRVIYEAAIYSASQINKAMIDYYLYLDFQIIEFPAFINKYFLMKRLVNESLIQSESV